MVRCILSEAEGLDRTGEIMERNTIYCGDCADIMATWPADCIDLVVTSPPYDNLRIYNGYTFDFEAIAQQLWRVTKPGGVVVWVVADATVDGSETFTSLRQALYFRDVCGFKAHDTMIFNRRTSPLNDPRYEQEFEYMFVFVKGKLNTFNGLTRPRLYPDSRSNKKYRREKNGQDIDYGYSGQSPDVVRGNIWKIPAHSQHSTKDKMAFSHPAIFPEALARDHIISWSNPGDLVLDPMCGSGTVPKMCIETGRQYVGIDISQEYCDLARRRVAGAKVPLPGLLTEPDNEKAEQAALW